MPMAGCHKSRGKYIVTGGVAMATSAFERKIVISDAASKEKLTQFFWNRTHLRESGPSLSIPAWKENGVKSY